MSPEPPPGETAPDLTLVASAPQPLGGTVVLVAEPVGFVPDRVTFRRAGDPVPLAVDETAPFEATVDTTGLADGLHTFVATGRDDDGYVVSRFEQLASRNDPNVVVVYLDDLDVTTSASWDALAQTKALLVDQGLTFSEAFVTDPVCCPARASMLTGRVAHNTGVFDTSPPDGGFETFRSNGAEADTVASRLRAHGYATAFLGKYLIGYDTDPTYVPPAWSEWFGLLGGYYDGYDYEANHNGVVESYGSDPADYQTDVLATRTVEFLDATETRDDQPYFLLVAPSAPHVPMPPAPRHQPNPFAGHAVPTRPNFDEADVSDKPTWLREGQVPLAPDKLAYLEADHPNRMGSLLAVDDLMASILSTLAANDELDETYVVLTSDNGYNLGAHRLLGKQAPYEESIRVPFVVRGPGVPVGTDAHMVTNIDVAATALDLAGLDWTDLDGRSLAPLLAGDPPPTWRDDLLVEFHGTYEPLFAPVAHTLDDVEALVALGVGVPVPTYRALRTQRWLYVEWYAGPEHEYELYDLPADPHQLENLLATPEGVVEHTATTAALQARLEELGACGGASCRS